MSADPPKSGLTLGRSLSQAARLWRRVADRRLKSHGLSESAWRAVLMISREPEPPRQKDLAEFLSLEGSSVVRLVDGLEKNGYVLRTGGVEDRRAKRLSLTAKGLELVSSVEAVVSELELEAIAIIAPDDLAAMAKGLDALRGFFESELAREQAS